MVIIPQIPILHKSYVIDGNSCTDSVFLAGMALTVLVDENGIIVFANDKVKAAEDVKRMLG